LSLGLIMRLRIVAREHHAVTGACKVWVHRTGEENLHTCGTGAPYRFAAGSLMLGSRGEGH
jgi:hypothetical protein